MSEVSDHDRFDHTNLERVTAERDSQQRLLKSQERIIEALRSERDAFKHELVRLRDIVSPEDMRCIDELLEDDTEPGK